MPLTYCTNIHPGESWADVRRNLDAHLLGVKARVSPQAAFPIGLRVSGRAAGELDAEGVARFRAWCDAHDCYVLTLNGFPHGRFHGPGVKQGVYLPDWREPLRAEYTCRLADLLSAWLPAGVAGSISSVPIAFRAGFDEADWKAVHGNLGRALRHLARWAERGVAIDLALEPEPGCVLERTADVLAFFERLELEPALRDRLALCFDCCHQAVEFEDPAASLRALVDAGVRLAKVQVSSSLRAVGDEVPRLLGFDEPSYLHQVVARTRDGRMLRFDDLPGLAEALGRGEAVAEARCHFHVPIFAEHLGPCGTTRGFLEQILPRLDPAVPLEVETYSWGVLSPELRGASVVEDVSRELEWVRGVLAAAP